MIRRVRKQFICITMTMLTTILLVPLIALNVITEAISYNQTRNLLEQIAINETAIRNEPNHPQYETPPFEKEIPQNNATTTSSASTNTSTITTTSVLHSETSYHNNETTIIKKSTTTANVSRETKVTTARRKDRTAATKKSTKNTTYTTAVSHTKLTAPIFTHETEPPPPHKPFPEDPHDPDPWFHPNEALSYNQNQTAGITQLNYFADFQYPTDYNKVIPTGFYNQKKQPDMPPHSKSNILVTIDHFICFTDKNGLLTDVTGSDDYEEEECQMLVNYVFQSEKTDGLYENFQFYRKDIPDGTLIVFSDRSSDQLLLKKLLAVSILVFFCMEGVVFFLTMVLTKHTMKPMQETFERQRQFISDAGHELKTPLTIISANVDILQDEIGTNKWLSYIHSQTERMGTLINNMMNLTKMDMGNQQQEFIDFSLSTAVTNAVLPFESQAFEQEKKLQLDIQENINYTGNAEQIKQLTAIFIDNAIKYSNDHGEIRVKLEQTRDKKILTIYNTGKGITESEKEKIFERFYRVDTSRARATGGYGLGLSIAKSIADAHKIKIQVKSQYEHWICFTLIF